MSADATNISKRTMDCGRVAADEILEKYLAGTLTDEDREAFEEHYFGCARCFDDLQILQSIRAELLASPTAGTVARPARRWTWAASLALAAVAVLAVAATLWMRRPPVSGLHEQTASAPPPTERPEPRRPQASSDPLPSLDELARVEPPPYEALALRGTTDEAMARFRTGMDRYRRADYRGAVSDLRAAAALEPAAPGISFFLGVSHLMLGHDDQAIAHLRTTVALGDSAYFEDAHWYLAKGYLRRRDLGAAETELKTVIQLHASRADEALRLLADVTKLKRRPQ